MGPQKGIPIGIDDDFARRLAGAVRIGTTESIVFGIGPLPFPVPVDLVGSDHYRHLHTLESTEGIQDMDRSLDIGGERVDWLAITGPHQRLGRQMENNLRPKLTEDRRGRGSVPDVHHSAQAANIRHAG